MSSQMQTPAQAKPLLLFDGECAVCRYIGRWVLKSSQSTSGGPRIAERPIGDNPEELRALNPHLDIWDAYATIHVLMPDGTMKLGGEAVAEVLRDLPNTRWFAWLFSVGAFGFRPFQTILNVGYVILADVRPLLGCESCGTSNIVVRSLAARIKWAKALFAKSRHHAGPHFTPTSGKRPMPPSAIASPDANVKAA
jgi:predicted DCC family thiol-disulfide oxidoreductase YuxK